MYHKFLIEYFFDKQSVPSNYGAFASNSKDYRVGVVTYDNFFSHDELLAIEKNTYNTERKCFSGN